MRAKRRFPLMAKVALWLAMHLLVLAAAFALFVGWQLRLGLDSLLSGATGERLDSLGREISRSLADLPRAEWDGIVAEKIAPYGLEGFIRMEPQLGPGREESVIPVEIIERAKKELPPPERLRNRPPPFEGFPGPDGPRAALELVIEKPAPGRPPGSVLFLRSGNASANGLFFDTRPWLLGGLAVLVLSVALWAPFVLGITRYAGRISKATARIAEGHFDTKLGANRNDELGRAGESIEEMSARLGQLISGQRRFLGDVAHELCAPLARMRTGLGILQNGADGRQAERLASIEEDAEELSTLVSELLAFTKANASSVNLETIPLAAFCHDLAARELEGHKVEIAVPEEVAAKADRRLLARALQNVLRNCHRHAGEDCAVRISATASKDTVNLEVEDNGSGVPEEELPKLFEPFYRPDKSRTRETGGTGLGMAIVESSVRACGGKSCAEKSEMGGLLVRISLPKG